MHRRTRLSLRSSSINDKENEHEQAQLTASPRKRRSKVPDNSVKDAELPEEDGASSPKKVARKAGRPRVLSPAVEDVECS